jgi:hypothetical protein
VERGHEDAEAESVAHLASGMLDVDSGSAGDRSGTKKAA